MELREDTTISRHLHVGGEARISGPLCVGGDMKVEGWLEAPYVKGVLRGLFSSVEKLERSCPFPREGWAALVGDTLPADVYRAEGRRWTATGEKGGGPQLALDAVIERIDKESGVRLSADDALEKRLEALEPLTARADDTDREIRALTGLMHLAVEAEQPEILQGRYFNFRGVVPGDIFPFTTPETTSETGFTASSRSFSADSRRAVVLTAKGNDMVRGYVALDEDFRVLAMASNEERIFEKSFIILPEKTRHLLMESFGVPLEATIYGDSLANNPDDPDGFTRRKEIVQQEGKCYDFGEAGDIGDVFNDSRIAFNSSIPTSRIAVVDWRDSYRLRVSMNTGTPNVWGIAYLDSSNVIIGRETPFRQNLNNKILSPPPSTARIVFQTYDPELFPMEIKVEYSILDIIDSLESQGALGDFDRRPLKGKRMIVIGDSLSAVRDASGRDMTDYLAALSGADIVNCAAGGARLSSRRVADAATPLSDHENAMSQFDAENVVCALADKVFSSQLTAARYLASESARFAEAAAAMENADLPSADIMLVFAGSNDYKSGVDPTSSKIGNAVENIARRVAEVNPHLRVVFATPLPRMENPEDPSTFSDFMTGTGAVAPLPAICGKIADEARKMHFPVIDLYDTIGWNAFNFPAKCKATDGTHPVKALPELARALTAALNNLIT